MFFSLLIQKCPVALAASHNLSNVPYLLPDNYLAELLYSLHFASWEMKQPFRFLLSNAEAT
jgi:hypothetical protein